MRRFMKLVVASLVAVGLAVGSAVPAFASESGSILAATNSARAANGLAGLNSNGSLNAVAQAWAQHMADAQSMTHNPNVLVQIPSGWGAAGENVAMGFADGAATVAGWMNSAGHRANILNGLFNSIGVGWVVDSNGVSWAVQVFAKYTVANAPVASAPAPAPAPAPVAASAPAPPSEPTSSSAPGSSTTTTHAQSAPAPARPTTQAAAPVTSNSTTTVTQAAQSPSAPASSAPSAVPPPSPAATVAMTAKLAKIDVVAKASKSSAKTSKSKRAKTRSSVRRTAAVSQGSSVAVNGVLVLLIGAVGMWIFFAVRRIRIVNPRD